ncbi:retrovirus-related pol polyprotein from transposon TNT 1-94, partial [Tanacetum coccineum]
VKDPQAKFSASSKKLYVLTKRIPPVKNCILSLVAINTWALIDNKSFGIRKSEAGVGASSDVGSKWQALGAVRLSLAKNVAYNVVNKKTTYNLFKALSSMYEKLSTSNKVFLIRRLVNMKMKEGAFIVDHVNEFNSILSRLMDKEVNMAAEDYNDALVCCFKNMIDDRIIDSGASRLCLTYAKKSKRFKAMLRYIPDLKKRLISVGQLDEEGYRVGFKDQQWKVTKGSLVVARGNKRRSMCMVEVPSDEINASIDGRGNTALWNQRLGHKSEKGMKILASNGRILDLQKAVADPTTMLPLLVTVAGRVLGFFLKIKSRWVFTLLPKITAALWNPNLRVKCLKFDNGGEYNSREFIEYCAENGIRMLKTGSQRCFGKIQLLWQLYLINREPFVPLGFQIPELEWQGKEVSLAHLRVFGCDSYVKVKDVARDKLDAKFVKHIHRLWLR